MRITVFWVYLCISIKILSLSLNTMLTVEKHCSDVCCDEHPVPQIDRKSKQVKEQWHGKFYLQPVCRTTCYFKHWTYKNLWMNNKVRGDKHAICLYFLTHLLDICRKLEFLISQGNNICKVRWVMSYGFCTKFHTLSNSAKNCENL